MKANTIAAITLAVFFCTVYACKKKDACDTITCQNGGTCVDGNCQCPTYYTGANCETEKRAAYFGNYNAASDCNAFYTITIATSASGPQYVSISNIDGYGTNVFGVIQPSDNYIDIPVQTAAGGTYNGHINYTSGTISATFLISRQTPYLTCTGSLTKQ